MTKEGLVLPKVGKVYAKIDNWEWGGMTSVEVLVNYSSFDADFVREFRYSQNNCHANVVHIRNNNNCYGKSVNWLGCCLSRKKCQRHLQGLDLLEPHMDTFDGDRLRQHHELLHERTAV